MSDNSIFQITVPVQHADIHLIDANETYLFAGRGSFKTSVGISLYIIRRVFEMPRSTGVCVGLTFEHLMDNTLPPVKAFLASKGFVEGIHYVIMRPPPAHWPKPYAGVLDPMYKHAWTWCNGTSIQLISLRRKASANGVSAQWGTFDEVKFMSKRELEDEIFPIFRPVEASDPLFRHLGSYMGKFFATDKNADPLRIRWLLEKRKLVDHKKLSSIRSLQENINTLLAEYAGNDIPDSIQKDIAADNARLNKLRSSMVYVSEISAEDVRPILGNKWYRDKKKNSSERDFNVIYKNLDPVITGDSFYPAYTQTKIEYSLLNDIDYGKPLIISTDYQHTVTPIPIAQLSILPGQDQVSLNYIDQVYTLHPDKVLSTDKEKLAGGLRDAVKRFCDKYSEHPVRIVYYVFDHTARGGRVDADEYWEIVVDELQKHNWEVIQVYTGQAPGHYQKFLDTMDWMNNENGQHPDIRINNIRCPNLVMSITGAKAKTVGKETKKDKAAETSAENDQSETTHFSDAFDMINDAVLKQNMIQQSVDNHAIGFR